MPRLVLFFVATLILLNVLGALPGIGGLFHGLFGFWIVAILLSIAVSRVADAGLRRRRLDRDLSALGQVDSPHNQGKLGSLYVNYGRYARALPHLEKACAGEPHVAEWQYRRGLALLATGRADAAADALKRAEAIDPEHAYGGVQIALARALAAQGNARNAVAALDRHDRERGPTPESAYWRGIALKKAGLADDARASLREVGKLARAAARFQRKSQRAWVWRAWLARFI